jgi:hypothetical protein
MFSRSAMAAGLNSTLCPTLVGFHLLGVQCPQIRKNLGGRDTGTWIVDGFPDLRAHDFVKGR